MHVDDDRCKVHKVRVSTRIVLTWQFWRKGYMPLEQAIRTFMVKAA